MRWHGYKAEDATWEPLPNLTRSHVVAYHQTNNLELPARLDDTIDDLEPGHASYQDAQDEPGHPHVIDDIVDHRVDEHTSDLQYKVRWFDSPSTDDTWEPLSSLPRNKIIAYHRRNGIPVPASINEAVDG